ncbi:MAG TPA: ATP-binding protein [Candidatus Dormibacteraeota bacterium]|nr:ATP-binding protein [Candidatus Dormibacteraeota bacterium]
MVSSRTYWSAAFIATRPLVGSVYLLVLLSGLSVGLSATPFVIGIPIIALTFACAWGFAVFERQLARWWLGADVPPMSAPRPPGRNLWQRARDHLTSAATWKGILYLTLQFPAGVVALTLEVVGISAGIAMLGAPVWYLLDQLTYRPNSLDFAGPVVWLMGNAAGVTPQALIVSLGLLAGAGFLVLAWVLYMIDLAGRGWAAAAARLLGLSESGRQLAEARLIAATERKRAERADQSRRELIVNVSHELRTPIASIRAHVESLAMRDGKPLDPEVARYLEVINRETERLSALVDDLLAVARAEAGELKLTIGPVSVGQVVRHVHDALGPMARVQRKVTLVERMPEAEPPLVLADADRLTQVMMNLVRNAVSYTAEGGLVAIEVQADGPGGVALTVSDTGIGIPREDLDRVFDRFYRTDASRTRSSGGFGLGLSIARDLVEAMGGTISIESEVGSGSRFTVHLPVAPTSSPSPPLTGDEGASGG